MNKFLEALNILRNRFVYLTASGMMAFFGSYALLRWRYPERFHDFLTLPVLFLEWFIATTLLLVSVYPVIAGRMRLPKWSAYYFRIYMVPVGLLFAFTAGASGEFYYFAGIFLAGGLSSGLGYVSSRMIAFGGLIFSVMLAGFLALLQPDFFQERWFTFGVFCLGMGWLSVILAVFNQFVKNESENVQRLLRGARRDKRTIAEERKKADRLLLNILPESVARELKETGRSKPVQYRDATVLFTDFKGFTRIAEGLEPEELIGELDRCFSYFDSLMDRYHLEKLKTIGDSFMCAGGLPEPNGTHAIDCALAALEIQAFMNQMKTIKADQGFPYWELRLGIHSGPLVAGVIGEKKFAYDVWGDTVNTASRLESAGVPGRINLSASTLRHIESLFLCTPRGRVTARGKGEIEMYFLDAIRPELSVNGEGRVPNSRFEAIRKERS